MGNESELRVGTQRAKDIVARHILNKILVPMADAALKTAVDRRIEMGHNMTGNTVNSYVVGVFVKGHLAYMRGSWESVPKPLTHKVVRYQPGRQRWDGDIQEHPFPTRGVVGHNGATEPDRAIAFINSYQANPNAWVLVVANGIEYATFEENVYNADALTGASEDFKFTHQLHFNPLPD